MAKNKARLPLWIKSIFVIWCVVSFIFISLFGVFNVEYFKARKANILPCFLKYSYCSVTKVSSDINIKYKKSDLLIIQKFPSYQLGEEIIIKRNANSNNGIVVADNYHIFQIHQIYDDSLSGKIIGQDESLKLSLSEPVGKVTHIIPYIGSVYHLMTGEIGLIIFFICPIVILTLIIIFMILKSSKLEDEYEIYSLDTEEDIVEDEKDVDPVVDENLSEEDFILLNDHTLQIDDIAIKREKIRVNKKAIIIEEETCCEFEDNAINPVEDEEEIVTIYDNSIKANLKQNDFSPTYLHKVSKTSLDELKTSISSVKKSPSVYILTNENDIKNLNGKDKKRLKQINSFDYDKMVSNIVNRENNKKEIHIDFDNLIVNTESVKQKSNDYNNISSDEIINMVSNMEEQVKKDYEKIKEDSISIDELIKNYKQRYADKTGNNINTIKDKIETGNQISEIAKMYY